MDWTTIITTIMASLTTIAVAVLGLYQTRKTKDNDNYRKLREQLDQERQAKLDKERQENTDKLSALETTLKSLQSNVESLNDNMKEIKGDQKIRLDKIDEQLSHLRTIESYSFTYMESLSSVVTQVGETMNDSDLISEAEKQKISNVIDKHSEIERKIHDELYKAMV